MKHGPSMLLVAGLAVSALVAACGDGSSASPGAGGAGGGAAEGGTAGASGSASGAAGSGATSGDGGTSIDMPCAVYSLLHDRCVECHSGAPDAVGPMPLLTRADLLAPAPTDPRRKVGEVAAERVRALVDFMPPEQRMTEATSEPLVAWVQEGMPAASCDIGTNPGTERPFEPLTDDAALAKVKSFLTGRAPSEAEYLAYRADSASLPGMIDGWLGAPEFSSRLLEMLTFLFQQRVDGDDVGLYLRFRNNAVLERTEQKSSIAFRDHVERSFALTARSIVEQGRPFTDVLTTRTYMLNVPLMALLARIDARPADDLNVRQRSWIESAYPNLSLTYTTTETIPWADSVNPASPNFMRFSVIGGVANPGQQQCSNALTQTYNGAQAIDQVWQTMVRLPGTELCWRTAPLADVFTAEDREFRPVTLRRANAGERRSLFWDLPVLRASSELVLGVDHAGFLGSLGFLGYWTTNDGNEYRVTTNQALIVALGKTITSDSNTVADTSSVDAAHAAPDSPCYGCHKTLDPMRDFLRQSYTYWGSERTSSRNNEAVPAQAFFTIDGSPVVAGNGVGDFTQALASHPAFAKAWTLKVCGLANASPCLADDAEIGRVAGEFAAANFDFKVLLRQILSSPVVTYRTRTKTWNDVGASAGIALRDDLCRRLENRFGIRDACSTRGELDAPAALGNEIRAYAGSLPALAYERGGVEPQMATDPNVFSSAATERLCERLAGRFLGTGSGAVATPLLDANDRSGAIDKLLHELMGLSRSDARAAELRSALESHWDDVLAGGQPAAVALQSTFVLACSAPFTTTLGL